MSVVPLQRRYSPPPAKACQVHTLPFRLPKPGQELYVACRTYRDHIVDFSVTQSIRADGQWMKVAQILQEGGSVRLRQYTRSSQSEAAEDLELQVIPTDGAWDVVDRSYAEAVAMMQDNWEENLRRWNDDSA
ncbi:hypothetical protein EV384_0344 [Micromonospora kangleipakensis]|uniref:Uncharacterized protein n=1 Tax=Micromonospora kangleipakensis TaxID=1077942 RepID=A0A4Q8B4V3_9ACTN|nr:hypothetical protein EV384_0344 [Micromonospora kangleipakensis]